MKKLGIVASCLVVVLCHAYQSNAAWVTKGLDTPRPYFEGIDQRSIAVASDGTVHVAYGGDHIYHAYNDGSTWHYETVDASPGLDVYPSLALDSSGKVHLSYIDYSNALIKYATNASGSWITATVVNNVSWREHAIALDANDKVYIIFRDAADLLYKYVTNSPGHWSIEATNIMYGSDLSLAVDISGKIHISYRGGVYFDELKYATNASGSWVTTYVDAAFDGLNSNAIALDSNGKAHIGYTDYYGLSYATNATGVWVRVKVVDMGGNAQISAASIALDTNGKAHISYSEWNAFYIYLKYATNASGSWLTRAVDSNSGSVGEFFTTSIALNASGSVHISYCDGRYSGNLKHAWCDMDCGNTGSWHNEVIDRAHDVGMYASLALDSGDKTHMSYFDAIDGDLKYITNASGSWTTETVDSAGWTGLDTSIALDPNDKVHISYRAGYLKYTTNASGSWVTETVDSDGSVGRYNSLALDSSGKVHISYIDDTNNTLKYATNALGSWLTETVDSSAYIFSATAIAVGSLGIVHISYYDDTNRDLKYATNASGIWVMETIDSNGDVGWDSSLVLDSNGWVHISYCDYTNNSLKYATNASGSWVTETIGTSGGWYTSLVLDAHDKAHISFYDGTNGDLKYVTNASSVWITETIDSNGDVGAYSSIALDFSGNAYIGYYDTSNHDLKYAHQCLATDTDCDDILAADDNCPLHYNPDQADTYPPQGNGIGDACDCEGDFVCDGDVDGSDASMFKADFGRSPALDSCVNESPCNGDFNCDGDVDGTDASLFQQDFGRSSIQNPCPACVAGEWCVY